MSNELECLPELLYTLENEVAVFLEKLQDRKGKLLQAKDEICNPNEGLELWQDRQQLLVSDNTITEKKYAN